MQRNNPTKETAVKESKKVQSISRFFTSPKKPISDLIAIINSEVATAFFIGNLASNTKAGMIKKPPPAPITPVMTPTTRPSIMMSGYL